jgi:hypothetical protein
MHVTDNALIGIDVPNTEDSVCREWTAHSGKL